MIKFIKLNYLSLLGVREKPGVYILSKTGDSIDYVGRSDVNLKERLKSYLVNGKYKFFTYLVANLPEEAFYLECKFWHKYQPRDNTNHPDKPEGSFYYCPVCKSLLATIVKVLKK